MRSTFAGFEASKAALFTSQKSLDITGHNLSNITTEGYTRQRADQDSVSIAGNPTRLMPTQVDASAMGTKINGVSQLRDERLDAAFRTEYATTGYYSQTSTMLGDIESILQELDEGTAENGYNLSHYIKEMYNALEEFSHNASSPAQAGIFSNSIMNVTTALNEMSEDLTECAEQYKEELYTNVGRVNTILAGIAEYNYSIRDCIVGGSYSEQYGPNELQDKRNLLLDELAGFGELKVQAESDGTVTVTLNGQTCVEGDVCDRINYQDNSNGTVSLYWKTNGQDATLGIGTLKAVTDILNGRGKNAYSATESTEEGFLYYQDKLDVFAEQLANVLNNTIPATFNEDGTPATYRKLVGELQTNDDGTFTVYPDMLVTADHISVTDAVLENPGYVIYDKESTDNTYILEMIDKLTNQKIAFSTGTETFTGTFAEYVTDYTSTLGSDVAYAETRYQASYTSLSEILDNRDSVSGVSETEETVNMMTFNKAFQAAARMMTVMDDMLDVIINQMAV